MDFYRRLPVSVLALLFLLVLPSPAFSQELLLLSNARIVNPESRQITQGHLIIAGNKILETVQEIPVDFQGVTIDLDGKWIIPGLNDSEIPEVLRLAKEAGARSANYTALRLPGSVAEVFATRIRDAIPLRADRILSRLRDIRGGRLNDSAFSRRMAGEGAYWESIRQLFEVSARKLGLDRLDGIGSG